VELFDKWRNAPIPLVFIFKSGQDQVFVLAHLHADHHATSNAAMPTPMAMAVK